MKTRVKTPGVAALSLALMSLALVLSALGPVPAAIGGEAALPTIGDIEQAWQRREARFRSGSFVWKEVKVMARGSVYSGKGRGIGPAPMPSDEGPIPPSDGTYEYQRTLKFEGPKLRYSENEAVWSSLRKEVLSKERDNLWDGKLGNRLSKEEPADAFEYRGSVRANSFLITAMLAVQPILAHCRPSLSEVMQLRRLSVTGRRGTVDNSSCIVVEGSPGLDRTSGVNRSIWVDPQRDFIILRWRSELAGKVLEQIDVFYVEDPAHGWLPSRWKRIEHGSDGRFRTSVEATIVEQSVNAQMKADDFRLEFPPGTLVSDQTATSEDYQKFFVLADGTRRIVTAQEMRRIITAEELARTEPGQAGLAPRKRWRGSFVALNVFLGLLLVTGIGVYLYRRSVV